MDASEFEFPPDQLDGDVPPQLPQFAAAAPPHVPFAYPSQNIPLSALAQIPLDQLPPTQPRNQQNFSIGQAMRGALTTAHMRNASAAATSAAASSSSTAAVGNVNARLPRPAVGVALTSEAAPPQTGTAPSQASYLAIGHHSQTPPQRPIDRTDRGRVEGDGVTQTDGNLETERTGLPDTEPVEPALPFSGRHARLEWSEGEVRSFYQALSQFGTDFSAIAVLFPRRSRNDIKRLYQREMRLKPKMVQLALSHKNPIDVQAFKARFEEKKKEEQQPVKTKKLNKEEQALVDEIESGLLGNASTSSPSVSAAATSAPPLPTEDGDTTSPAAGAAAAGAASSSNETSTTSAPSSAKSRKRKRDQAYESSIDVGELEKESKEHSRQVKVEDSQKARREDGEDSENESLFDLAMRHDREDNAPLDSLFMDHTAPIDDSEFAFE